MRYNIHEVLDILKPTRKQSGKYEVWRRSLKNYTTELWEDLERIKQGLEPLQIIEDKEDKENAKPTRLFFSINNEGIYDKWEVNLITDINLHSIVGKTRNGQFRKNKFTIKRINNLNYESIDKS